MTGPLAAHGIDLDEIFADVHEFIIVRMQFEFSPDTGPGEKCEGVTAANRHVGASPGVGDADLNCPGERKRCRNWRWIHVR